jgi:hypothetical protein
MATRKTLDRQTLVSALNTALASDGTTVEDRRMLAAFADGVLLEGNAYKGFGYQRSEWNVGGTGLREGHDDTRRLYY